MTPLSRAKQIAASCAAIFCLGTAPLYAQETLPQSDPVRLSPSEMQATAFAAIQSGEPARALALSEALLLRDPHDPIALRIGAQAALEIEQTDAARRHATTLFQTAETPEFRYLAARLAALAETQAGRYTRAQLWLRRARQLAPDEEHSDAIAADFAAVRARNPLNIQASFGLRPSSNVNNGSSSDTFEYLGLTFQLSPDSKALSGFEASAQGRLAYTLHQTDRQRTQVTLSADMRRYWLSDEAKEAAPGFDAGRLSFDRWALGLRRDWLLGEAPQPVSIGLTYGVTQLGGEAYAQELEFDLSTRWRMTDTGQMLTAMQLGRVRYDSTGQTAESWAVNLGWLQSLDAGRGFSVVASLSDTSSDDNRNLEVRAQRLRLGYDFGEVGPGFDLSVSLDRRWSDYGQRFLSTEYRSDTRTEAELSVGIPAMELYGFAPVGTINAYENESNVARYSSRGISMGLSFESAF